MNQRFEVVYFLLRFLSLVSASLRDVALTYLLAASLGLLDGGLLTSVGVGAHLLQLLGS